MPGTRSFFVACLGLALLFLIVVPVLGGLFAPQAVPDDVAQGFRLSQINDCAGCHTLNGQGGGYASDLTHIYSLRGEAYLRQFLLNPVTFASSANPTLSHIALSDVETERVLAFLKWTDENTGDFWHHPVGEIGEFPPKPDRDTGIVPDSSP